MSLAFVLLGATTLAAQELSPPRDSLATIPARTVRFETTQGTAMNVDVSPDGRTIVFDLLGDIYTVPMRGGTATRLTSGPAFDAEPVFSPNGTQIAFVSDGSGSENIWLMKADGSNVQAFTSETTVPVTQPEWVVAGDFILVARRADGYAIYRRDGRGTVVDGIQDDAVWSRDGRFIYVADERSIRRVEVARGRSVVLRQAWPRGFRPAVSPDGRWVVFGVQVDSRTGLRRFDLASRQERWLAYPLPDRDNSTVDGTPATLPRFAFTPDGKAIVLATGGTFQRVDLRSGRMRPIRFRATVEQRLRPRPVVARTLPDLSDSVRAIRHAQRDRSGRHTVFTALGKIWVRDGAGSVRPLIDQRAAEPTVQRDPALSPDGQSIAYVTWHDAEGGQLWRVPVTGGAPRQLTTMPAVYRHPVWSPDGTQLAVVREDEVPYPQRATRVGATVYVIGTDGGSPRRVAPIDAHDVPAFSSDGATVVVLARPTAGGDAGGPGPGSATASVTVPTLLGVTLGTGAVDTLAVLPASAEQVVVAPDGQRVAYTVRSTVYVASIRPAAGLPPGPVTVAERGGLSPATAVADDVGPDLRWAPDSRTLSWVRDGALVRVNVTEAAAVAPEVLPLAFPRPRRDTSGSIALEGATVITMRGDEVLRDATVLVTGTRIAAVGPRGSVALPAGVRRLDVTGTTIMPGLINLAGAVPFARDRLEATNITLAANLAFGVTTVRVFPGGEGTPAAVLDTAARYAELLEAGGMTGARLLTGGVVAAADAAALTSLDAARALIRRQQALGTIAIAQTVPLTRRQRRWLATAAREAGLSLVGEGGDLRRVLTMAVDGYHTVQGAVPNAQLYDDVRRLLAAAQTVYVPTLLAVVGGPGSAGRGTAEDYFVEQVDLRQDPKLQRFALDTVATAVWRVREDYHFLAVGCETAQLAALGTPVAVGTVGKRPGLGVHWELWALELGGVSAHEALRAATAGGAEALGLGHELGTVEAGKLADLVVLDGNPLTDLRQSRAARYVMRSGALYDAVTLAQRWPRETPPPPLRNTRYDPPAIPLQGVAGTTTSPRELMQ